MNLLHAKSVHAFDMREALPIPYITHAYRRYTKNLPRFSNRNGAYAKKVVGMVWTTYVG